MKWDLFFLFSRAYVLYMFLKETISSKYDSFFYAI